MRAKIIEANSTGLLGKQTALVLGEKLTERRIIVKVERWGLILIDTCLSNA
jgi:hypothetical protein